MFRNAFTFALFTLILLNPAHARSGLSPVHETPTAAERLIFTQLACAKPLSKDGDGVMGCPVCPQDGSDVAAGSGGDKVWNGWTFESMLFGHFTGPAADEALLHSSGCEAHARDFGGDFLLRREADKWAMIRYISGGVVDDKCQRLAWLGGRQALVCEHQGIHQGETETVVLLITIEASVPVEITRSNAFLYLDDNTLNCGYLGRGPHAVQRAVVDKIKLTPESSAPDAALEVEIFARVGRLTVPNGQAACPQIRSAAYHLRYRRVGDHMEAVEGLAALAALKDRDKTVAAAPIVRPTRY